MDTKRSVLINSSGQSTVEYLLLFAVVIAFVTGVFKSNQFESLFGEQGRFANVYRGEIEYTYRHGRMGDKFYSKPNYNSANDHESYKDRFFGAREKYPRQ